MTSMHRRRYFEREEYNKKMQEAKENSEEEQGAQDGESIDPEE